MLSGGERATNANRPLFDYAARVVSEVTGLEFVGLNGPCLPSNNVTASGRNSSLMLQSGDG